VEQLVDRFGALAIFLGTAVEGDATAVLGGVIAHLGLLGFPLALATAFLGAFAGDLTLFALGRVGAPRLRASRAYRRIAPLVERLATRFGAGEIVLARFVYGTRVASMVFWGVHGLSPARFVALDLLGCALWATAFTTLGFAASGTAAVLLGEIHAAERWLAIAVVAAATVVAVAHLVVRRRLAVSGRAGDAP
jgi:membrane protein DedA with SNARE-associated domain